VKCHYLLLVALCGVGSTAVAAPVITLEQALQSTRQNNISWKSLSEVLKQADAGRDMGIGLLLPKLQAQGQWVHMGERNVPDLSSMTDGTAQLVEVLGTLTRVVVEEHPNRIADFLPYLNQQESSGGDENVFESFVPPADTLSATFSVIVPVLNPKGITTLQGAYDRYDAAVQQIGYGRDQLLFGVCKAYYGLATLQGLIDAAGRSVDAGRANFESKRVKAGLQAATQLEVKRAELELAQAEARRVDLQADLKRTKSTFRYLTGIEGEFDVVVPEAPPLEQANTVDLWIDEAKRQRRDLTAARISVKASERDVLGGWFGYLPTVDLIGQAKLDNAEEQRFDDDPFSWNILGTLTWNLYDGGISQANLSVTQSRRRQAELTVLDLEHSIVNQVVAAEQSLRDAVLARELAEGAVSVARDAAKLTEAAEAAGAVTSLEVIDVNNAVFQSEAGLLAAQLREAMARLDLFAAAGQAVPFGDAAAPEGG